MKWFQEPPDQQGLWVFTAEKTYMTSCNTKRISSLEKSLSEKYVHIPGCQKNGAFHIWIQKNRAIHIFFVEKRGPIIYLAALKKGAIRNAHPYYAIYRKLPPPRPPPPPHTQTHTHTLSRGWMNVFKLSVKIMRILKHTVFLHDNVWDGVQENICPTKFQTSMCMCIRTVWAGSLQ